MRVGHGRSLPAAPAAVKPRFAEHARPCGWGAQDRTRHAQDVEKARAEAAERIKQREIEIQRLRAKIDAMQETLSQSGQYFSNPADKTASAWTDLTD